MMRPMNIVWRWLYSEKNTAKTIEQHPEDLDEAQAQTRALEEDIDILRIQNERLDEDNTELIARYENCRRQKDQYQQNLGTIFEMHIGWRPHLIDGVELQTILISLIRDERSLRDGLLGLARPWAVR